MPANQVLYVNNHGGGLAERRNIEEGETIEHFLARTLPGVNLQNYQIRVNREEVIDPSTVLRDGATVSAIQLNAALPANSTVSVTPKNIPGAFTKIVAAVLGVFGVVN